ncbi:MAG: class I SAM-dependent methyltransferase [Bdellovibrionota bacterium]|nr:class I SAM-dependent methyltransferase [Bdellovibrionota bacterium]
MSKESQFWDKIATKYSLTPVSNEEAYRLKLKQTEEILKPHFQMLEIGCGTGTTALYQSKKLKKILATDISQNMIDIAKRKQIEQNCENVEFSCLSVDEIEFTENSYDVIAAHSFLHLVEDKKEVLDKCYKALKPGGYLITSTACIGDFLPFLKWITPLAHRFNFLPLIKVFKKKELENDLESLGFKEIQNWRPFKTENVFIISQKLEA